MNKLLTDEGLIHCKVNVSNVKSNINYDIIRSALSINGLSTDNEVSSVDATTEFIKLMRAMDSSIVKFANPVANRPQILTKKVPSNSDSVVDHDIKHYTKLYHPIKIQADEKLPLKNRLSKLRDLCQKMPFERSSDEVDNIFRILKTIPTLSTQVDNEMLKLLSNVAIFEYIDEPEVTLFGNRGFYVLLSGTIKPLSKPSVRMIGESIERFNQTNNHHEGICANLSPGECFGTLDEIFIDNVNCSKFLLAETLEACELMLITTSYYRRVLEKYNSQKHGDKLALFKGQEAFTLWPHQALVKIANIFTWTTIPANTLVCKEGVISPYLAFIKSGSCYVLRKLEVKETLPNGKVVIKTAEVKIGILGKNKSFGEASLLDRTPMMHSILTKDDVVVMQSDERKLLELDHDVKLLLRQSCSTECGHITKADVESIYVKQKSKKDWATFKENVIADVIDSRGIRPGQGKWSVTSNQKDLL